jgi:hypothetical protein
MQISYRLPTMPGTISDWSSNFGYPHLRLTVPLSQRLETPHERPQQLWPLPMPQSSLGLYQGSIRTQ